MSAQSTFFDYYSTGSVGHACYVKDTKENRNFVAQNRVKAPTQAEIDAAARFQQQDPMAVAGTGTAAAKSSTQQQQKKLPSAAKTTKDATGSKNQPPHQSKTIAGVDYEDVRFAQPKSKTSVNLLLRQRSASVPDVPTIGNGGTEMHEIGLFATTATATYAAARRACQAAVDNIARKLLDLNNGGTISSGSPIRTPTNHDPKKDKPFRFLDTSFFLADRESLFPEGSDPNSSTVGCPSDVIRLSTMYNNEVPLFDLSPPELSAAAQPRAGMRLTPGTWEDEDDEEIADDDPVVMDEDPNAGGVSNRDPFTGGYRCFDELQQGTVGDHHLLSAVLAVYAAQPQNNGRAALKKLFVLPSIDMGEGMEPDLRLSLGVIGVLFYLNGGWMWVVVDDTIATGADSRSPTFVSVAPKPKVPTVMVPPTAAARLLSTTPATSNPSDVAAAVAAKTVLGMGEEAAFVQRQLSSWAIGLPVADSAVTATAVPISKPDAPTTSRGVLSTSLSTMPKFDLGLVVSQAAKDDVEFPSELWPFILEKAFAKLHSCFDGIDGGIVREALASLLGGCEDIVQLHRATRDVPTAHGGDSSDEDDGFSGKRTKMKSRLQAGTAPDVVPDTFGGDDLPLPSASQRSVIQCRARIADHRAAHPEKEQRNAFGGKVTLSAAQVRAQKLQSRLAGGGGSMAFLRFQELFFEQDGMISFGSAHRSAHNYDISQEVAEHRKGETRGTVEATDDGDQIVPKVHPEDQPTLRVLKPHGWYPVIRTWRGDKDGDPRIELYDGFSSAEELLALQLCLATKRRNAALRKLLQQAQMGRRSEASVASAAAAPIPISKGSRARFVTLRWSSFLAAFDRVDVCRTLVNDPLSLLNAAASINNGLSGQYSTLEKFDQTVERSLAKECWSPLSYESLPALWHTVGVGDVSPPTIPSDSELASVQITGGVTGQPTSFSKQDNNVIFRQHPLRPLVLFVEAPVRCTVGFTFEQEDPKVRSSEWHVNRKGTPLAQLSLSIYRFGDLDPNTVIGSLLQSKSTIGTHTAISKLLSQYALTPRGEKRYSGEPEAVAETPILYRRQIGLFPLLEANSYYLVVPRLLKGPALPYAVQISSRSTSILNLAPLGVPSNLQSAITAIGDEAGADLWNCPGGRHARRLNRPSRKYEKILEADEQYGREFSEEWLFNSESPAAPVLLKRQNGVRVKQIQHPGADPEHVTGTEASAVMKGVFENAAIDRSVGFAGRLLSVLDAKLGDMSEASALDSQIQQRRIIPVGADAVDEQEARQLADRRTARGVGDGKGGVTTKLLPRWSADDQLAQEEEMRLLMQASSYASYRNKKKPKNDEETMPTHPVPSTSPKRRSSTGPATRTESAFLSKILNQRADKDSPTYVDPNVQLNKACGEAFKVADISSSGILRERRHVERAVAEILLRHTSLGAKIMQSVMNELEEAKQRAKLDQQQLSSQGVTFIGEESQGNDFIGVTARAFSSAVSQAFSDEAGDWASTLADDDA